MIEVRDLGVVRGGTVAVADLTFEVGAGTVTGLVGPSGSGKTTLMRVRSPQIDGACVT